MRRRIVASLLIAVVASVMPVPFLDWVPVAVVERIDVNPRASAEDLRGVPVDDPIGTGADRRTEAAVIGLDSFAMIGVAPEYRVDGEIFLRTRVQGTWTDWQVAGMDPDEGPDAGTAEASGERPATEGIWVGEADAFQVNLPADAGDAQVIVVREQERAQVVGTTPVPADADIGPAIAPRVEWGARPAREGPSYGSQLKLAVVHHSATSNGYTAEAVPGIIRAIQAYHMDGRGWNDIGYNFVVDRFGRTWEGRAGGIDALVVGAHAEGFNTNTMGVTVLGEYTSVVPTAPAVEAVGRVIGWRMFLAGVDPASPVSYTSGGSSTVPAGETRSYPRVIGHRDVGSTACPGNQIYGRLDEVRSLAKLNSDGLIRDTTPFGSVDVRTGGAGTVTIQGWVIDPDAVGGTGQVRLSIEDRSVTVTAVDDRSDVGTAYPAFGAAHGYLARIEGVPPGQHRACVTYPNPGPGVDVDAGCANVTVTWPSTGPPVGAVTSTSTGIGRVTVSGWVIDPDAPTNATSATVEVGDRTLTVSADRAVNGLGAIAPGAGDSHGFEATFDQVPGGSGSACLRGTNVGTGVDLDLGCAPFATPTGPPEGRLETATWDGATLRASGWAFDPDVAASIQVDVTLDTALVASMTAAGSRPDIGSQRAGYGDAHGFSVEVGGLSPGPGRHTVCVVAVDTSGSRDQLPGCTAFEIAAPPPPPVPKAMGAIQSVTAARRSVTISGWALDSVDTSPVWVWIVVGKQSTFVRASAPRWGMSWFFPNHGDSHGYGATIRAPRGSTRVCAASFTVAVTALTFHGCRTVRVR